MADGTSYRVEVYAVDLDAWYVHCRCCGWTRTWPDGKTAIMIGFAHADEAHPRPRSVA